MDKINRFLGDLKEKDSIYIYGAGTHGRILGEFFEMENVQWIGYIDEKVSFENNAILGKKVNMIEHIEFDRNDYIIVSLSILRYSLDVLSEIKDKLSKKGVDECNIRFIGTEIELMDDILAFTRKESDVIKRNIGIKNIYEGRRCFLVGNGPSLCLKDLEKIKGDISFGCNNIIDVFSITEWRPSVFLFEDSLFQEKFIRNREELEQILGQCMFAFTSTRGELVKNVGLTYDNLYYFSTRRMNVEMKFSDDMTNVLYGAGTTMYSMIQIAVYMGFSEIYLLGVDHTFRREINDGTISENKDICNHAEIITEVEEAIYNKCMMDKGYECAKKYADLNNIKIYNATRGGMLEVFERVDFDSLF